MLAENNCLLQGPPLLAKWIREGLRVLLICNLTYGMQIFQNMTGRTGLL
jgi:hypothetical protein